MLRFAAAAATSLMLLTSLSGCGGDPPAAQAQPSRTPTSPSSSPTPTPPALPAAAKRNTKAGAKAFVRHYIDLINYAQATGSTAHLAQAESKACGSCKNGRHYLNGVYRPGGEIIGGAWKIRRMSVRRDADIGSWHARVLVHFGPQTIKRVNPVRVQRLHGGNLPVDITAIHFENEWKVLEWTRER